MKNNIEIRKSVIYTSNILNTIYTLNNSDIKEIEPSIRYVGKDVTNNGSTIEIGLIDKTGIYHFLSVEEIYMYDILLSWDTLTNTDEETSIFITFKDIDWIKNRQRRNKDYVKENHKLYADVLKSLEKVLFKYGMKVSSLLDIKYIDEKDYEKGFVYNLGHLKTLLKQQNQLVELNLNVFKYSSKEFMKYSIMRYMISSIYMNQVKRRTFSRTHKSILSSITYIEDGNVYKYYDWLIKNKNFTTYIKRYYKRLEEVMKLLKESGFIKDYKIIPDNNLRSLITSCGKVDICTNVYKIKNKRQYKYVKK